MNNKLLRSVACVTALAVASVGIAPLAHAGILATAPAIADQAGSIARERLVTTLSRQDVQDQLVARGVDPALVAARVASLTDQEVLALEARIDQLPAGGDVVGIVVFIFVVLLITDLLGWTHVFPFTNKGSVGD